MQLNISSKPKHLHSVRWVSLQTTSLWGSITRKLEKEETACVKPDGPGARMGSPSRPGLVASTCCQQESGWLLPLKGRRMQTACLPSCLLSKYHGERQAAPSPVCAQPLGYVAPCPVHFLWNTFLLVHHLNTSSHRGFGSPS